MGASLCGYGASQYVLSVTQSRALLMRLKKTGSRAVRFHRRRSATSPGLHIGSRGRQTAGGPPAEMDDFALAIVEERIRSAGATEFAGIARHIGEYYRRKDEDDFFEAAR